MSLRVIVPPGAEPVQTGEFTTHSFIDSTDGLEALRVAAARQHIEDLTWRTLVLTTYEERRDRFPATIELQRAPVRAIVSIKYIDTAGDEQTLAATEYQADLTSEPCRIIPAFGEVWPSTYDELAVVRVQYRAGYAVPVSFTNATNLLTAVNHWFADTNALTLFNSGGAVPSELTNLGRYFARDVSGDTLKVATTSGGSAVTFTDDGTGQSFLAQDYPWRLHEAVKLIAAELNERREQAIVGTSVAPTLLAAENLAAPYRLHM